MSASVGNVIIVQDILKIIEPETFLYFYTKRPGKQRDFSMKEIFRLVDEFDNVESKFYAKVGEKSSERAYIMCTGKIPKKQPARIPYTFASMLAQIVPQNTLLESSLSILKSTRHVPQKVSEPDKKYILQRLLGAKYWVEYYAPDEYKIKLLYLTTEIVSNLSDKQKSALKQLGKDLAAKKYDEKTLYDHAIEIAQSNGLETKEFFSGAYLALLGKPTGPRLAQFILAVGQKEISKRLSAL